MHRQILLRTMIGMALSVSFLVDCSVPAPTLTPSSKDQLATAVAVIQTATAQALPAAIPAATVTRTPSPTQSTTPTLNQTPPKIPTTTHTPSQTRTASPTPGGPAAELVASIPSSIFCDRYEDDGCQWNHAVTFTETKGISATIESIGRRYIDRDGGVWTLYGGSGWYSTTITITAYGSYKYVNWVRTRARGNPDLMGGTAKIGYSGHDANGNPFSGEVTSALAWPLWPTFTPSPTAKPTATP